MKILIIVPGEDEINYKYMFPLGLGYISSVLKKAGHNVDCLLLNHHHGHAEILIHKALNSVEAYDYVCTGGLSVHYKKIKDIVNAVRRHQSNTGIILGGGLISSEPELIFEALNPEFIVIGEGEKAIVGLLSSLEDKSDYSHILGIGYRNKKGQIICNQPQPPIMDLDSLPWPDFKGFEFDTYLNNMKPSDLYSYDIYDFPRVYPIVTSRSCPYKCTFCFHPIGNKYRQRSIDSIIDELSLNIKRYKINIISIYDELFSYDKDRVNEFCQRIKKLFLEIPWKVVWNCQMRVEKLDEGLLLTMKDSGCYMVSYGFESFSTKVITSMKKHIKPEQIDIAVKLSLKTGISIQGNFLFGDRAETFETAMVTLNYLKNNKNAGIQSVYISPYPGTEIYQHCINKGLIQDKLDFIENHMEKRFNMTDAMTDQEFEKLKNMVQKFQFKYKLYGRARSLKKVEDGIYNIRIKCPHCHKIINYHNFQLSSRLTFRIMMYCRNCRRRFYMVSKLSFLKMHLYLLLNPFIGKYWFTLAPFIPGTSSFHLRNKSS